MRRSSSLRQGLVQRNTSSVEEVSFGLDAGFGQLGGGFRGGSIKIPLNGSIGLEVTPPADGQGSDSSESLDLRGTIVWRQLQPVVNTSSVTLVPQQPPTIFVCQSDD